MVFETIMESSERGELDCPYFLRYHLRRDGQLTIYEIWVSPENRNKGIAKELLNKLIAKSGVVSVFAKCPVDLPSNKWYESNGFILENVENLKSGRKLNWWRLLI